MPTPRSDPSATRRDAAGAAARSVFGAWLCALAYALTASVAMPAAAQTVALSGSLGDKALLIIDGAPRTVATGSTVRGVRLVSVSGSEAVVEVNGQRQSLVVGRAPVNLGASGPAAGGSQIVLSAGSGGHFATLGAINGQSVDFLVDTGATFVSMGTADADRLGIAYRDGPRGVSLTANGQVVVYKVSLGSVRVGDVQVYNVEAIVGPYSMSHILLGNSFLARFQMKRDNDTMTLTRRY